MFHIFWVYPPSSASWRTSEGLFSLYIFLFLKENKNTPEGSRLYRAKTSWFSHASTLPALEGTYYLWIVVSRPGFPPHRRIHRSGGAQESHLLPLPTTVFDVQCFFVSRLNLPVKPRRLKLKCRGRHTTPSPLWISFPYSKSRRKKSPFSFLP